MRNNDINLKLANVILDLAKQSEENGKYEDAIKSYKEVLNVFEQALGVNNEKTKEIYSNIGMCYKALGKNEEALSYLTKALSSGNATSVVSQQKETKIKQNRHNKAKETKTDRLLNDAEEFVCLGNENYDDENYTEAIYYYNEAIKIYNHLYDFDNVKTAECYYSIGLCYSLINKSEIAIYYLKKSLRIFEFKNHPLEDEVIEKIKEIKEEFYANPSIKYDKYEDGYGEKYRVYNRNSKRKYDEYEDGYDEEYSVEKAPKVSELSNYEDDYSDSGFWRTAKKLGKKVLKPALQLYYVLKEPSTPHDIKGMIIGALGYLILPVDLIPDFIPVAGYTDDFAAIMAVIKMCSEHITPEIERKVEEDLG